MVLKGVEKVDISRGTDAKFDIVPIKVPRTTVELDNDFTIAEEEHKKMKVKQEQYCKVPK